MKYIIWSSIVAMMACLTACFDDESSLGNPNYNDITITLPEDMSVMSFTGETLTIDPEVETGYDESTLTYAWYIYSGNEFFIEILLLLTGIPDIAKIFIVFRDFTFHHTIF